MFKDLFEYMKEETFMFFFYLFFAAHIVGYFMYAVWVICEAVDG